MLVLDEAHRVRDRKSKLYVALSEIRTSVRVLLSGYPMQNHLKEYWCMVDYARPGVLGTLKEFKYRFEDPIGNGQCVDSTNVDIVEARKKAFVLRHELEPMVLRRDGKFLKSLLGEKHEWVLVCEITDLQKKLYKAFLRARQRQNGDSNRNIISATT